MSMKVEDRDIYAVLGRNAVGKTTLLNVLTGVLRPGGGRFSIDGVDLEGGYPESMRMKIGAMRPIVGTFRKMRCEQYLEFVCGLYGVNRSEIYEASKTYEFESELQRTIKNCSAGTVKKIEFCAATIHKPKILFLDEPFEAVDPIVAVEMKERIKDYAGLGNSVIVTSHILDVVQSLCNKYAIINDGTVAREGIIDFGADSEKGMGALEKIFVDVVGNE